MKVLFVCASNSRSAGGLYSTMSSTTKALLDSGIDIAVLASNDKYSCSDIKAYGYVPLISFTKTKLPLFSTLGYSKDILKKIELFNPDIIHLQGLWMYHSAAAYRYAQDNPNVKIIIQPHGMLDPWALRRSYWKKWLVGKWFEFENLKRAHCIHALCQSEADSIRKFGLKNPIAIIPNGIDLPDITLNTILEQREKVVRNNGYKTLLFVGRIHPKKGIVQLVEALSILKKDSPDWFKHWKVRIAGWDQLNHSSEIKALIQKQHLTENVELIGPVFEKDKEQELINASAFILPSFSEGLPMSILEAWSYALPVVMTPYCNLPEGFKSNAALSCTTAPTNITEALLTLKNLGCRELQKMGISGRQLVETTFTWPNIAKQTIDLYNCLLYT